MQKAILVDIDGTLANVDHRVHYVQSKNKNWKAFSEEMVNDKINPWCETLIKAMAAKDYKILFITGRGESYRDHTVEWLKKHKVEYDDLFMRAASDHREDSEIKLELYKKNIEPKYNALFVIEDRASVVKMWRENGLVCLQCDVGDF